MFGQADDSDKEEEEVVEGWVRIQQQTFTNWVNDKLKTLDIEIENVKEDFKNGVNLCKLMECLKRHGIGKIIQKKHINHYEASGNLALAINVMLNDDVKLVNIGAEDVAGGNLKLILGMIWLLIRRYQIGAQSKLPPKKMMLYWINAVLSPHLKVNNFNVDWTDGVALHGIIEYCRPGTFPNWMSMSRSDRLGNCREAMTRANELFDIPLVVSPENFSSVDLDELSGMTYLSYFMNEGAPGYNATLEWVKDVIQPAACTNFTTDWNSGYVLTHLVRKLGGNPPDLVDDYATACKNAMEVSEKVFSVPHVISHKDLAFPEVDHIGVMAYAAWHRDADATPQPQITPTVITPVAAPPPPAGVPGDCYATVASVLRVNVEGYVNIGCPSKPGTFQVKARSPQNVAHVLDVPSLVDGCTQVPFTSDIVGEWQIEVTYDDMDVPSSPLFVNVFDPNLANIIRENGYLAYLNQPYFFQVDTEKAGSDNISCTVVREEDQGTFDHNMRFLSHHRFEIEHTPYILGYVNVSVFCEDVEIPGSPFRVEVLPDPSDIYVHGRGIESGITKKQAEFKVDAKTGPNNLLLVSITSPSGKPMMTDIDASDPEFFAVSYKPMEAGDYTIDIKYNGVVAPNSPFIVPIKLAQIYVKHLNSSVIFNSKENFELDATEMTGGDLEIDCGFGPCEQIKIASNHYMISFVPMKLGHHDMFISYDGKSIDGNPFNVDVIREGR